MQLLERKTGSGPARPVHDLSLPRRSFVVITVGIALGLIGSWDVGGDSIRPGVSVGGFDLGAVDASAARARLAERLNQYETTTITLRASNREWRVTPAELGIKLDVDQTLAQARRTSDSGLLGRVRILLNGPNPTSIEPVVQVDVNRLAVFIDAAGREVNRSAEPARLAVELNSSVKVTPAQAGRLLDRDAAAQVMARAAARLDTRPLTLPVRDLAPSRTELDLAAARDRAIRIVGRPVRLAHRGDAWYLSQEDLAGLVVVREEPGATPESMVSIDRGRLQARLDKIASAIDRPPLHARFEFADGKLRPLSEGTEGWKVDRDQLLQQILATLTSDNRTVEVPAKVEKPIRAADLPRLGINELIEEVSTDYAGGVPERRHNIELAASRLHGTLIPPGQLFSFNAGLGPTTLDNGYQIGWGITQDATGAKTVPSVAGGICQVATTLFQSAFWAGYQIEQRNWHLYWIPRYGQAPKGLKGPTRRSTKSPASTSSSSTTPTTTC